MDPPPALTRAMRYTVQPAIGVAGAFLNHVLNPKAGLGGALVVFGVLFVLSVPLVMVTRKAGLRLDDEVAASPELRARVKARRPILLGLLALAVAATAVTILLEHRGLR